MFDFFFFIQCGSLTLLVIWNLLYSDNRARELLACDKLIRMYRKTAAPKMKNAAVKEQSKEVTFSESADKQR
jgi:hypothetical protein